MTKTSQLTLIDTPRSWKMDERTREVGREGIARARAALRAGLRTGPDVPAGAAPPGRRPARGTPPRHAATRHAA
jgi:hypothetical protein